MHRWIVAAGAVAAAGLAGAAFAGADSSLPSYGGIAVNGSASETIAPGATAAQVQADYYDELGAAMSAAHAKALFVAARLGDTLGGVSGFVENTDVPSQPCTVAPIAAETPGVANGRSVPAKGGKRKSKKSKNSKPRKTAIVVTGGGCEVTASVTEDYYSSPIATTTGPTGASGPSGPSGPTG
jgi:hypothetical protein